MKEFISKIKSTKYFKKLEKLFVKFKVLKPLPKALVSLVLVLILLALVSSLAYGFNSIKNHKEENEDLVPTVTVAPSPTETITPTATPYITQHKLIPSILPTATKAPTSAQSTPTPTSAPAHTADTTPPTLVYMTGPPDGGTVDVSGFCFPMMASDNVSNSQSILTRYKFDSGSFNDWGNNYSPCYTGVANGSHTFTLEFKDEAGNSASVTRTFTVQVN